MSKKIVLKLIDKSLVLGKVAEKTGTTITIATPLSVTQMFNPQTGEPDVVMMPMDLIFAEAAEGKDTVTFKKTHIMYEKDMADFPAYMANYDAQTSKIAVVGGGSGVIES